MCIDPLILIIDDDSLDAKVIKRAISDTNISCRTHITRNGVEALNYLTNAEKEKPRLIFTDINMPKMDGIEFLNERKKVEYLNKIPTVVLTSSIEKTDEIKCFEAGIAKYIIKPMLYNKFKDMINSIMPLLDEE